MSNNPNEWLEKQPILQEPPQLSIIIPAYNEERRLPPTLIDMIDYCENNDKTYEIIVVNDGSRDGTSEFVNKIGRIRSQVKLITLPKNYGKGHAVRTGMLNAQGEILLFADADGATPIVEMKKLEDAIHGGVDVAIGSRAIASKDTTVKTIFLRKFMGRTFNFFVSHWLLPNFADTQCGFKMFTRRAAQFLFKHQQADEFSFDIEILFLARKVGLKIKEIPVNWTNIAGSKVNLVTDSMKMFIDIFRFKIIHRDVSEKDFQNEAK